MTATRQKAHDYVILLTSGILARAAALGLPEQGELAKRAVDRLSWTWRELLQPSISRQARTNTVQTTCHPWLKNTKNSSYSS